MTGRASFTRVTLVCGATRALVGPEHDLLYLWCSDCWTFHDNPVCQP